MGDRTAAFFDELGRAGHVPALEHASGTMRFELANSRTKPWLVTIAKGDMKVARANRPADCVVSADERTFDAVLDGRSNAMTAFLRGEIRAEGDVELLVLFQRLLPAEARPQ